MHINLGEMLVTGGALAIANYRGGANANVGALVYGVLVVPCVARILYLSRGASLWRALSHDDREEIKYLQGNITGVSLAIVTWFTTR